MRKPKLSAGCERFLRAILDEGDPAGAAAFAAAIHGEDAPGDLRNGRDGAAWESAHEAWLDAVLYGIREQPPRAAADLIREAHFNPDEPRDEWGRWTTGGSDDEPDAPAKKAAVSRKAQELLDLLRKSPQLREFLEKVAKGSTKVERGGFILGRVNGNNPPAYKIVEEVPKKPQPRSIDLWARPSKADGKWDDAQLPKCPPFGTIDMNKLPPGPEVDPDYGVKFWWHTHITGWVRDRDGLPVTGEPIPSEKDLKDEGVVGMMVKFDEVTKQLRTVIIERGGTFFETDPKMIGGTPQPGAH